MPTPPKPIARARARKAGLTRHGHGPDDPRVIDADRDLAAANLSSYIERSIATAPALTAEQVDRLTALFRSQAGGSDAA